MKALLAQRQHLRQCEATYNAAASMLDEGNGVALIVAKSALKDAREAYNAICVDYVEECIAAHQCEEDWLNVKDVGFEKYPQEIIA